MKVVVAAFNQEKALVGAFSVITNLRMELFEALITSRLGSGGLGLGGQKVVYCMESTVIVLSPTLT